MTRGSPSLVSRLILQLFVAYSIPPFFLTASDEMLGTRLQDFNRRDTTLSVATSLCVPRNEASWPRDFLC